MNKEQQFGKEQSQQSQNESRKVRSKIQQAWPNLNTDEVNCYPDQRDALINAVQKKQGVSREQAESTLKNLERQLREAA